MYVYSLFLVTSRAAKWVVFSSVGLWVDTITLALLHRDVVMKFLWEQDNFKSSDELKMATFRTYGYTVGHRCCSNVPGVVSLFSVWFRVTD